MKEWSIKNHYNSFNSEAKGLTYYRYFELINKWRTGEINKPPFPLEISLDPINSCNLHCNHCNYGKYLAKGKNINRIPDDHYINLIRFFAYNGSRAICHGGGGSPTMHSKLWDALLYANKLGLENSIATNGINFNNETIEIAVKTCRWIGVSVDSSNKETYKIGRKGDYFDKVIENISKLSNKANEINKNCDISFKFLVFDYNQNEIYDACKLAKTLGVKDFHVRIANYDHQGINNVDAKNIYDIDLIKNQYNECLKLESESFRVFCVTHKYKDDFTPDKDFGQCYASPLCLQVNPNGNVYNCPDTRNLDLYKLGEHYPNPENILNFWGGEKHYDLVFKLGRRNCKSRCTFNKYNKLFEELFIKAHDPMCRNFI